MSGLIDYTVKEASPPPWVAEYFAEEEIIGVSNAAVLQTVIHNGCEFNMGRISNIKWEKATMCRPVHNIMSSDFPKYNPTPWKFMEGKSRIEWLLSYEYQRMWLDERETWKKRMYPENITINVDIVKRYVQTFKTNHQPPKPEKKKPFKMKKFEGIQSKTTTKRAPGDKAMNYLSKKETPAEVK